ncbi:hypothetical protein [Lysobacter terrae]
MSGEFDRVRDLLWGSERQRLESLEAQLGRLAHTVSDLPSALADGLERENADGGHGRLTNALAESTADSLERAVRKRPQAVVDAVFPIIGPSIRRALQESLRGLAQDLDRALQDAFTLKALSWRVQAWRTGVPYAQIALRHRLRYHVDHLFLICAHSGLLIDHVSAETQTAIDVDAVAGMLTAIEQFVHDSMAVEAATGGLDSASVGEYRLLVSPGPVALVVAFVQGVPPEALKTRLDELIESLHAQHGAQLADGEREARGTILTHDLLADLNRLASDALSQKPSRALWVMLSIVLGAVLIIGSVKYLGWREARQVEAELAEVPGVVVLDVKSSGFHELSIRALFDPTAEQPQQRIVLAHPELTMHWQLYSHISSGPLAVANRVRKALTLPDDIQIDADASGEVRLTGALPFIKWYAVKTSVQPIPGGVRLNAGALTYPGRAQLEKQIRRIEEHRLEFGEGSQSPVDSEGSLESEIKTLAQLAGAQGIGVVVHTYGYTDEPGSPWLNRELRLRRAQWLAERIAANVPELADVDIGAQTISASDFRGRDRAARVKVTLVPRSVRPSGADASAGR